MRYEWMGAEYISREVWLRAATLDLITAGGDLPSGEVARMLSHKDLVAAVLEQLDTATRKEVEEALAWAWARVDADLLALAQ